jgi:hypothetical protein
MKHKLGIKDGINREEFPWSEHANSYGLSVHIFKLKNDACVEFRPKWGLKVLRELPHTPTTINKLSSMACTIFPLALAMPFKSKA